MLHTIMKISRVSQTTYEYLIAKKLCLHSITYEQEQLAALSVEVFYVIKVP